LNFEPSSSSSSVSSLDRSHAKAPSKSLALELSRSPWILPNSSKLISAVLSSKSVPLFRSQPSALAIASASSCSLVLVPSPGIVGNGSSVSSNESAFWLRNQSRAFDMSALRSSGVRPTASTMPNLSSKLEKSGVSSLKLAPFFLNQSSAFSISAAFLCSAVSNPIPEKSVVSSSSIPSKSGCSFFRSQLSALSKSESLPIPPGIDMLSKDSKPPSDGSASPSPYVALLSLSQSSDLAISFARFCSADSGRTGLKDEESSMLADCSSTPPNPGCCLDRIQSSAEARSL